MGLHGARPPADNRRKRTSSVCTAAGGYTSLSFLAPAACIHSRLFSRPLLALSANPASEAFFGELRDVRAQHLTATHHTTVPHLFGAYHQQLGRPKGPPTDYSGLSATVHSHKSVSSLKGEPFLQLWQDDDLGSASSTELSFGGGKNTVYMNQRRRS